MSDSEEELDGIDEESLKQLVKDEKVYMTFRTIKDHLENVAFRCVFDRLDVVDLELFLDKIGFLCFEGHCECMWKDWRARKVAKWSAKHETVLNDLYGALFFKTCPKDHFVQFAFERSTKSCKPWYVGH